MIRLFLLLMTVHFLTGCGGSSSAKGDSEGGNTNTVQMSGAVVDDYLVGAEVSMSLGPSAPEDTQVIATTDENGQYVLDANTGEFGAWGGELVAVGGFNKITSLEFNTRLKLRVDKNEVNNGGQGLAITPVTTLMAEINIPSQQAALAKCILGDDATTEDLMADYIGAENPALTAMAMKVQKSVELVQEAVKEALKDIKDLDSLKAALENDELREELKELEENLNLQALSGSVYTEMAKQLQQQDFTNCSSNNDPVTQVITSEEVVNKVDVETALDVSDEIIEAIQDEVTAEDKIVIEDVTQDSLNTSASNLLSVITDVVGEIDDALAEQKENLDTEKLLLSSELMANQGVKIIQDGENAGNISLAASVMANESEVDKDNTDFESLAEETSSNTTATSFEEIKDAAVLRLAFSNDLNSQYLKIENEEDSINLYFFDASNAYACIADKEDIGTDGKLIKDSEGNTDEFGAPVKYNKYKPNAMLLEILFNTGKLVINRVSDEADSDLKAIVDYGDGSQTFLMSVEEQSETQYFSISEDSTAGYERVSFTPFSEMTNRDSDDVTALNTTNKKVDCAAVTYLKEQTND